MTPYVQTLIPPAEVTLFRKIQATLTVLPDLNLGKHENGETIVPSCHMLARATGSVFGLKVQDGYFYIRSRHSWLLLPSGNIIDVYPVGMMNGPLLIHNLGYSPGNWLYKPQDTFEISLEYGEFHFGSVLFRKATLILTRALKEISENLGPPAA